MTLHSRAAWRLRLRVGASRSSSTSRVGIVVVVVIVVGGAAPRAQPVLSLVLATPDTPLEADRVQLGDLCWRDLTRAGGDGMPSLAQLEVAKRRSLIHHPLAKLRKPRGIHLPVHARGAVLLVERHQRSVLALPAASVLGGHPVEPGRVQLGDLLRADLLVALRV